jgi:hypothetical protein
VVVVAQPFNLNMTPVYRFMSRACAATPNLPAVDAALRGHAEALRVRVDAGELLTVSAFRRGADVFVYHESVGSPIDVHDLFAGALPLLTPWPDGGALRHFVPMLDIFHCGEPLSLEYWRRKQPVERYEGKVIRLRPEKVASYIFYHYQMQEEKPGSFDKYGIIGIHENLLFFYLEKPFVLESPPKPGSLSTKNTPDNWHEVMFPHFQPWVDSAGVDDLWRDTTHVLTAA